MDREHTRTNGRTEPEPRAARSKYTFHPTREELFAEGKSLRDEMPAKVSRRVGTAA